MFSNTFCMLQCETSITNMLLEANIIGKFHVGHQLLNINKCTLHVDGTSDHQIHYFGLQVSRGTESLALGMTETLSGNAVTQIDVLLESLHEVAELMTRNFKL
jgi:hypothetical protein